MIEVTRLNDTFYYINPDMILTVEPTPDTVITLTNGEKLMVKESSEEIVHRFIQYKRHITLENVEALPQKPYE